MHSSMSRLKIYISLDALGYDVPADDATSLGAPSCGMLPDADQS